MPSVAAVMYVKNLAVMREFYTQVTGWAVTYADETYVVLENAAFELTLHAIPAEYAQDIVITSPPHMREEAAIKLSFEVADLEKAQIAAIALGGGLPLERAWVYKEKNRRVCTGYDPEGNVMQVYQTLS